MALRERLYSFEEFWEYVNLPENSEKRLELDDGVIVDMGASTKINTVVAARIIYFLNAHIIPNNLGVVTAPDAGYKMGSRKYRQPDAAFIAKVQLADLKGTYFSIAPDLAVEVVSEDEDIFKKAREYLSARTRVMWAVYADERVVYVMTLGEKGAVVSLPFGYGDTLDGGDVLPGFALPVRDIFPE
jgi:Uma2 family endonuclease